MRIDLYTKTMLTVIAACLVALCFRTFVDPPKVSAQQDALRVVIAGVDPSGLAGGVPVNLVAGSLSGRNPLPVNVMNQLVPVTVIGAGPEGKSMLPVNVSQTGGQPVPESGILVRQK